MTFSGPVVHNNAAFSEPPWTVMGAIVASTGYPPHGPQGLAANANPWPGAFNSRCAGASPRLKLLSSRVPYKLAFYEKVLERLQKLRARGQRVLAMGDFNTAHRAIDLARPRENVKNSGFLPEERAALDAWVTAGWVDTFRQFVPELHVVASVG